MASTLQFADNTNVEGTVFQRYITRNMVFNLYVVELYRAFCSHIYIYINENTFK